MRHRTDSIVIHCSATAPDSDIGVDEIDSWHKARGWSGVGYHAVIRRDGQVEFGRHFDEPGAHVQGQNFRSVGVCLVGGVNEEGEAEENFTEEQMESLEYTVRFLRLAYPDATVLGHRDLSDDVDGDGVVEEWEWVKDCPCFDVRGWWNSIYGIGDGDGR
jgi:N-acetyl-anhydromuramyl-L-alanine amidase AmpD